MSFFGKIKMLPNYGILMRIGRKYSALKKYFQIDEGE
jgi:hypothetical protein